MVVALSLFTGIVLTALLLNQFDGYPFNLYSLPKIPNLLLSKSKRLELKNVELDKELALMKDKETKLLLERFVKLKFLEEGEVKTNLKKAAKEAKKHTKLEPLPKKRDLRKFIIDLRNREWVLSSSNNVRNSFMTNNILIERIGDEIISPIRLYEKNILLYEYVHKAGKLPEGIDQDLSNLFYFVNFKTDVQAIGVIVL